jgi:L-aspartate oxidase
LAPRDVVSKSIVKEMRRTGSHVFLDLTHLDPAFVRHRFPRIYQTCLSHNVDITAAPAPVHPAAHYAMGGVHTDLSGRTSVSGLWAAGEVACTGVHGANRLASNSLLEGVVFGARAGCAMRDSKRPAAGCGRAPGPTGYPAVTETALREIAWEHCGIVRSGEGLREAVRALEAVELSPSTRAARVEFERRNIHAVALLIARCALAREESRGAHQRTDYPETSPEFQRHSYISNDTKVCFA